MTDKLTKMLDPLKAMREYQDRQKKIMALAIPDPLKEMREYQERRRKIMALAIPDPLKEMREYQERQRKIMTLAIPDPLKEMRAYQERWLSRYERVLDVHVGDVAALEGGLFSVSGEVIDAEHIQQDIISISEDSENQEQFLDQLFAWYDGQTRGVKILVVFVLYPIIVELFFNVTPLAIDFVRDHTHITQKEAMPEIVKEANELFTPSELHGHRFTTASVLNVRMSGSEESEKTNSLPFGTPVRVLDKSEGWTNIEFKDPNTDELENGWVSSKYLRSFNK